MTFLFFLVKGHSQRRWGHAQSQGVQLAMGAWTEAGGTVRNGGHGQRQGVQSALGRQGQRHGAQLAMGGARTEVGEHRDG